MPSTKIPVKVPSGPIQSTCRAVKVPSRPIQFTSTHQTPSRSDLGKSKSTCRRPSKYHHSMQLRFINWINGFMRNMISVDQTEPFFELWMIFRISNFMFGGQLAVCRLSIFVRGVTKSLNANQCVVNPTVSVGEFIGIERILCPVRANIRVFFAISYHSFRILATILDCDVTIYIFWPATIIMYQWVSKTILHFTTHKAHTTNIWRIQAISLILVVISPYDVLMTSYVKFDVNFEFLGIDFL